MPGNTASGDQTDYLRMGGFWPSYNVPFYKNIYDVSGNAAAAEKYGPSKSYELAPRAKIFRRDAPNVNRTGRKNIQNSRFFMIFKFILIQF